MKIIESSGTSKKSDVADKKWEEYTEQEIKLKENYLKWKQKQLEKGAKEEDLLTEEQYISQVYFTPISPRIHPNILGQGCASFNDEFFEENSSCWYCYICCYQVQMKF